MHTLYKTLNTSYTKTTENINLMKNINSMKNIYNQAQKKIMKLCTWFNEKFKPMKT